MSRGGINEFLTALFSSEGGVDPAIENKFGYIGKYQFGEDALFDIGYYLGDSSSNRTISGKFKYDWSGKWSGKNGADSKGAFLKSVAIQDMAARDWIGLLCKRMKRYKLDKYIGETINGVLISESGIIAAAHLKGFGSAKHPGIIQFLSSGGSINGEDAFGTSVSDYARKFADYDLGCCKHVAVTLLDLEKAPIPGLSYEIKNGKRVLKKGKTDSKGQIPKFSAHHSSSYEVFVHRIEGGMKRIASFAAPAKSALITLMSPKLAVESTLERHEGAPGAYQAGQAEKQKSAPANGKAQTSPQRGTKGNPVAVAHAPLDDGKKLSGADWETEFPTSSSVDDLVPAFKDRVSLFIAALKEGGAKVRIAATFRPKERAYLMHYCCKIGNGELSADKVPPMTGVNIEWVHRDTKGDIDTATTRAAACAMMQAYVIRYPAALDSRHTQRRAIDMTITGYRGKTIKDANSKDVEIADEDSLYALGKTYGVMKLVSDQPHWSDDGH